MAAAMTDSTPVPSWNRAVLKVGSALVAPDARGCSTKYVLAIARFIAESRRAGKEVVLVSSGAVAAGLAAQHDASPPRTIPEKQALAAIGQPLLMAHWRRLFDAPCAQLLLTYDDLYNRTRYLNAKNTLNELLGRDVLPIVNENDTVAIDELKVGDNDNLAAHVAVLADADALIICSDVDGLYDANPHTHPDATLIRTVDRIDARVHEMAGEPHSAVATGGMRTKVEAAEKATGRGITTMIVNGTKAEHVEQLRAGTLHGTLFRRMEDPLAARKHWMLHAVPTSGRIWVDAGAARALREDGASLLPSGITGVEGGFTHGDAVEIVTDTDDGPAVVAKGFTQYGSRDVSRIRGRHSDDIGDILGHAPADIVVHRDELVLLDRARSSA
jgi:glutamate 5-kinase